MSVDLSADTIVAKVNGVIKATVTDSFNVNATQHGLYADTDLAARLDDFSFVSA